MSFVHLRYERCVLIHVSKGKPKLGLFKICTF